MRLQLKQIAAFLKYLNSLILNSSNHHFLIILIQFCVATYIMQEFLARDWIRPEDAAEFCGDS